MCQDTIIILYFKYSIITEIAVLPSRKMYVVYIVVFLLLQILRTNILYIRIP